MVIVYTYNMKARFKDKQMDKIYQYLLGMTPQQVCDRGIWGSILAAFTMGYEKHPQPCYMPRNCAAYAAYIAGKETIKT